MISSTLTALSEGTVELFGGAQPSRASIAEDRFQGRLVAELAAELGYAAAQPSRLRRQYNRNLGSGDYVLYRDREDLVRVSRNLDLEGMIYEILIESYNNAIVGCGFMPRGKTDLAKETVKLFEEWAEDPAQCDARQVQTYREMQWHEHREKLLCGDILTVFRDDLRLQHIESERIVNPNRVSDGKTGRGTWYRQGVEVDESGVPIWYHIADFDDLGSSIDVKTERIDARFASLQARRKWINDSRGTPQFATQFPRIIGLEEYTDAVETAAKLHAIFAAIFKAKRPGQFQSALKSGKTETNTHSGRMTNMMDMERGKILTIGAEDSVEPFQPTQPTQQFEPFVVTILKLCSALTGIPYEMLYADVTKSNFSVSRLARILKDDAVARPRAQYLNTGPKRTFRWWLYNAILKGVVPDDPEAHQVEWPMPPMRILEPAKEIRPMVEAIENNLISKEESVEQYGRDLDRVLDERAREVAREKELGIKPNPLSGSAPKEEGAEDEKEDPTE